MRYTPLDGGEAKCLAPEGVAPQLTVVERSLDPAAAARYKSRRRAEARVQRGLEIASASPIGSLVLSGFLPLSLVHLGLIGYVHVFVSDCMRLCTLAA